MKLGRRNLLYSLILAGMMLLFLVGYFIYMLPSLYVDYRMEQNLKSIREQHETYVKTGTYEGVQVNNSFACISVKLPKEGTKLYLTGKMFSVEVNVTEKRLVRILEQCREKLFHAQDMFSEGAQTERQEEKKEQATNLKNEMDALSEILEEIAGREMELPVEVRFLYRQDVDENFEDGTIKIHSFSEHMYVLEANAGDGDNKYTNYIAVELADDNLYFSFLPVVTPEMKEIRPVVLQSIPMLGMVVLLMVLLFSQLYSKGIVTPVVELVEHAEEMKCAGVFVEKLPDYWQKRGDEIGELADTLDEFYLQMKDSYEKLAEKNKELAEENKRQEIFLRASSHQLKTPIAAALLLVDGMMNKVGKYEETEVYLPKVKEQLLAMRKMVEDILYLNHCAEQMKKQPVVIGELVKEKLRSYQIAIGEKALTVRLENKEKASVRTDEMMISQILDNLLSNAVKYTPKGEEIRIYADSREVRMENDGVFIPDKLLPHIFEPFVSGSHDAETAGIHSHGMGLYIVSYYAKKLGVSVSVRNGDKGVVTILCFEEE